MGRLIALLYGVVTYLVMFVTFLYLFGFLANMFVPKGVDDGAIVSTTVAMAINIGLILLFGLSHSIMARPGFKAWWTSFVPKSVERTTYVLVATLVMILLLWQWRPMTDVIWQANATWLQGSIWTLYLVGIVLLFASTFVIDHFDLFGLRQVVLNLLKKPYVPLNFKVTFFYKFVRHPLYVGWFLIFWATPMMTFGHLLLAIGMSAYILIAIRYEERDMVGYFGETYKAYQSKVPMLIPRLGKVHETVKGQPSDALQESQQEA